MHVHDAEESRILLPFVDLIDALRDVFRAGADAPLRHHHAIAPDGQPDTTLLLMPVWNPAGLGGVKTVNVNPGNSTPEPHRVYRRRSESWREAWGTNRRDRSGPKCRERFGGSCRRVRLQGFPAAVSNERSNRPSANRKRPRSISRVFQRIRGTFRGVRGRNRVIDSPRRRAPQVQRGPPSITSKPSDSVPCGSTIWRYTAAFTNRLTHRSWVRLHHHRRSLTSVLVTKAEICP